MPSGFTAFNGNVKFYYPSSWSGGRNSQTRYLTHYFQEPSGLANIQVYKLPGNNADQAIRTLVQFIESNGQQVQYEKIGNGNGYTIYRGSTTSQYGTIIWVGAFKPSGNSVSAFIPCAQSDAVGNFSSTIDKIISSAH